MNKRGFTLVELLAVIIILSLLALLTSTAVTKLVKDAKDDLSSTQIELIKSAAQTWGADNLTGLPEAGKCSYLTVKNLKDYGLLDSNLKIPNSNEDKDDLKIKISTKINEKSGKIITTYEVDPQSVEGCYQQVYNNGEVVYYDVFNGVVCTESDYLEDNSKAGYNGIYEGENSTKTTDNQNGCLKFYAFLDSGTNKINLLLDHDLTDDSAFKEKNLYELTKEWDTPYISKDYILDRIKLDGRTYEIQYTKVPSYEGAQTPFKARFIEAQEVAKITGADVMLNWDERTIIYEDLNKPSPKFYLDGAKGTDSNWTTQVANSTKKSDYYWLFDRTRGCLSSGCLVEDDYNYAYFTSSYVKVSGKDVIYTWAVTSYGTLDVATEGGIRPVIELLKSNL